MNAVMMECECCRHIPGLAEYVWRSHSGNECRLCESCVGWWLINALDDAELNPRSVELLLRERPKP